MHTNECRIKGFVLEQSIQDISLCDEIIEFFKNNPKKVYGRVGNVKTNTIEVVPEIKLSTDCALNDNKELLMKYYDQLKLVADTYVDFFKYSDEYSPWGIKEQINVQHYAPSQGYYQWHTERATTNSDRHLVFMTYLNDVTDGGETEFYYQNLKVQPKKGKTLIWPADWTHTHRGITSRTQEKYIVTGWFSFI